MNSNSPYSLNFNSDLDNLGNEIAAKTFSDNSDVFSILVSNLNSLYGMLGFNGKSLTDIFPITNRDRAVKFMIFNHAIGAFQLSSTIFSLLICGQYTESEALLRSLIELVAYAEYYYLHPDFTFNLIKNFRSIPSRSKVFISLKKEGSFPPGGPEKNYIRYQNPAHANFAHLLSNATIIEDGPPIVTNYFIRLYNKETFNKISLDMFIPLNGIQGIYQRVFYKDPNNFNDALWLPYWLAGHKRDLVIRAFPKIKIIDFNSADNST